MRALRNSILSGLVLLMLVAAVASVTTSHGNRDTQDFANARAPKSDLGFEAKSFFQGRLAHCPSWHSAFYTYAFQNVFDFNGSQLPDQPNASGVVQACERGTVNVTYLGLEMYALLTRDEFFGVRADGTTIALNMNTDVETRIWVPATGPTIRADVSDAQQPFRTVRVTTRTETLRRASLSFLAAVAPEISHNLGISAIDAVQPAYHGFTGTRFGKVFETSATGQIEIVDELPGKYSLEQPGPLADDWAMRTAFLVDTATSLPVEHTFASLRVKDQQVIPGTRTTWEYTSVDGLPIASRIITYCPASAPGKGWTPELALVLLPGARINPMDIPVIPDGTVYEDERTFPKEKLLSPPTR